MIEKETSYFCKNLKLYSNQLTRQQLKTLKGQALSGNLDAAKKGLHTLLNKK